MWTSHISSAQQLHVVSRCHIDRAIVDDYVSTIHSRVHFSARPGVVCTYSFLDLFIIGCLPCVRLRVRLKVSKSKMHIFKNIMTVSQDKYNRRGLCKLLWKHGSMEERASNIVQGRKTASGLKTCTAETNRPMLQDLPQSSGLSLGANDKRFSKSCYKDKMIIGYKVSET